jgi:hypothetical protein
MTCDFSLGIAMNRSTVKYIRTAFVFQILELVDGGWSARADCSNLDYHGKYRLNLRLMLK